MVELMQNRGSVVVVESSECDEYWQLPLVVSSQTRGYVRGMSRDWRSSKILQLPHAMEEEFLREV
jgi:hypothetical protein